MDRQSYIIAMGHANPEFSVTQERYSQFALDALQIPTTSSIAEKMRELGSKTGIERRYFCRNDMNLPREQWTTLPADWPKSVIGMGRRNELYVTEAPKLAVAAARAAVANWGGDAASITHIVAASCTGVMAPGLETYVMSELGVPHTVQRYGLNLMGCFAAFRALSMAKAFADQSPDHRILVVCCELCSIHFRADMSFETFVGNALFADGAAAVVVQSLGPAEAEAMAARPDRAFRPVAIRKFASQVIEKSFDQMTWRASDDGFIFRLSPQIPASLEKAVPEFVTRLLGDAGDVADVDYAVHPGGRKIIEDIEKALGLPANGQKTAASWNVLRDYGNMSSATFLFVLAEKLRTYVASASPGRQLICGMGFGPGLSLEGVLLEV